MPGRNDEDKFSMYVPEDDADRKMPDRLELLDNVATGGRTNRLQGGAYDPYQKRDPAKPSDTARIRRPRVDLRRLSDWIKTTQQVKALREADALRASESQHKPDDGK
jgi:hypothetical protein